VSAILEQLSQWFWRYERGAIRRSVVLITVLLGLVTMALGIVALHLDPASFVLGAVGAMALVIVVLGVSLIVYMD